jgi:chromate transport protein ChrA
LANYTDYSGNKIIQEMSQLFAGATFIVLGVVLLAIYNKASKSQKENTRFQTPYLKIGAIGFLLFGLYFLVKYFSN